MCMAKTSAWNLEYKVWNIAYERKITEISDIALPNGENMKEAEDYGYMYLGTLESDEIKEKTMREQISKECVRPIKLV